MCESFSAPTQLRTYHSQRQPSQALDAISILAHARLRNGPRFSHTLKHTPALWIRYTVAQKIQVSHRLQWNAPTNSPDLPRHPGYIHTPLLVLDVNIH